MKRQTAPEARRAEPGVGQWAAEAAAAVMDRARQAQERTDAETAQRAQLLEAVARDGPRWIAQLADAIAAAVASFNHSPWWVVSGSAPGHEALVVHRTEAGAITVRAGDRGFVVIVPLLDTTTLEAPMPGVTVRWRVHGRGEMRPFDFVIDADDQPLRLAWDGEWLAPDAAARHILEPWVRAL